MNDVVPVVRRVRGAGLELAYREWNIRASGLPVVLLHGITASSADWSGVAAALPGRRLIALDARGHGASDWAADEAYQVDMHFADVAMALDDLGIQRCVLVGYSMGGGSAIVGAACLPERVARLVVVDAYPFAEQSPGSARIARWVSAAAPETRTFDPAISRRFRELLDAGVSTRADLTPFWMEIACPVTVVRGSLSRVLPEATAQRMVAMLPHAELVTIDGVAHGVPYHRPRELAAVIAARS